MSLCDWLICTHEEGVHLPIAIHHGTLIGAEASRDWPQMSCHWLMYCQKTIFSTC